MRVRDIFIVGTALLCCIIGWSQQGTVSLLRGFKIAVDGIRYDDLIMAKPIVVDVDGEGKPVLITASSMGLFSIYDTHYISRNMEGVFIPLPAQIESDANGRAIAFGTGYLSANSSTSVLAVMSDEYMLSLYTIESGEPHMLWEVEVAPSGSWVDSPQASVLVAPERVYDTDVGMVAVAVTAADKNGVEYTLFAAFNGDDGKSRWRFLSDAGNELDDVVREAAEASPLHMNEIRAILNLPAGAEVNDNGVGRLHERPWSTYREAVIAALPHQYNHPWDAQLRPHAIYPAKSVNKQRSRAGAKMTFLRNNRLVRMDAEDYGVLGEKLNLWNAERSTTAKIPLNTRNNPQNVKQRRRRRRANALVFHGKSGIEVLHMYTGNTITRVTPLKSNDGTCYHDINDDYHIEAISTQIGPRVNMDGEHRVDLIDDCLGMIYTGVPVAEDEVANATICDTQGFFGNLQLIHHFVDGDVRGEGAPRGLNALELLGSRNIVSKSTKSVPPLVVQVHHAKGRGLTQMERYAVFMIDTGLLTCVDPSRRRVLWRAQTDSGFTGSAGGGGDDGWMGMDGNGGDSSYPHLAAYSFYQRSVTEDPHYVAGGKSRYRRSDPYVIAVGDAAMTVVNTKNGKVVRRIPLPEPPIAPIMVVDFNGDGINDVIVVTARHIYGFVGVTQASTNTITSLMVLMVALLVLLFVVREVTSEKGDSGEEFSLPAVQQDEVVRSTRVHKRATD